ncbi:CRAL/TRIO domain-containing protein [Rickenella mellea]|uniref:CRAL/TRIO domain-containing protein n=1 Tax=Rickenella mellea TaxID=50990 RepID=A0A4Y7PXT9_9AGAM|nr:CRAL/TRIO domain-containing protein [Rickenella mellea]
MPEFKPIPTPATKYPKEIHGKLSDDQEAHRKTVLAHFNGHDYQIPDLVKGQLSDEEKFWLSNECILRYLRATKWEPQAAIKRLEDTLKWRREYGLYDKVTAEHVEPEGVTGKEVVYGYDTHGRPCLYMFPSRQNTTEPERQLEFAVWMMERAVDLMGPGVEALDLMINFADRSKNPTIATARTMLHIIQSHYPERLGLAVVINVPFLINAFFKLILPFVDPITRNKIKFNPTLFSSTSPTPSTPQPLISDSDTKTDITPETPSLPSTLEPESIFTPDMVMSSGWGGSRDFTYSHEEYWPALVSLCTSRRAAQMSAWRALGGKVGISEWDVKCRAASSATFTGMTENSTSQVNLAEKVAGGHVVGVSVMDTVPVVE